MVTVQGQADLLEVVGALDAAGCFTRRLDRRQQERDQDRDDRNDHQELDQREPFARRADHGRTSSNSLEMKMRWIGGATWQEKRGSLG